jgi:hypothetical protein
MYLAADQLPHITDSKDTWTDSSIAVSVRLNIIVKSAYCVDEAVRSFIFQFNQTGLLLLHRSGGHCWAQRTCLELTHTGKDLMNIHVHF